MGVKNDLTREVLAVVNNPTEGSSFWHDIFKDLKTRGVQEINLVVSDGLQGIETVIEPHFKMAEIPLCTVHLQRECQKYIKPKHKTEMAEDLRTVFCCDDKNDTQATGIIRWKSFYLKWQDLYPVFERKAQNEHYEYYFTYLNYDYRMRNLIYSTIGLSA